MGFPSPHYVKSVHLVNPFKLNILIRILFADKRVGYYRCRKRGCLIKRTTKKGSYNAIDPIIEVSIYSREFNFFQKLDMTHVDQVKSKRLELTINPNADPLNLLDKLKCAQMTLPDHDHPWTVSELIHEIEKLGDTQDNFIDKMVHDCTLDTELSSFLVLRPRPFDSGLKAHF